MFIKVSGLEESEKKDSATELEIRVSTTVRMIFRKMYPEEFESMRNFKLNRFIASHFSSYGSGIEHYFKAKKDGKVTGTIEVRNAGDFYYFSAIRKGYIDILTIKSDYSRPENPRTSAPITLETKIKVDNMIKKANIKSFWPQIYGHLKSPPQGINLGSFPSTLPPINKIIIDDVAHQEEPNAVGYVSTEDVDGDGNLDTIHISSQRMTQELQRLGVNTSDLSRIGALSPSELAPILSAFVEVLSHEMGHLKDYRHGEDNPFPGGESVADSAANQAVQQISVAKKKKERIKMAKNVMKVLSDLANNLDDAGDFKTADEVTELMHKISQDWMGRKNLPSGGEVGTIEPPKPRGYADKHYANKMAKPGEIQPPGDPFSYNWLEDEEAFVVAKAPETYYNAYGAKITRQNMPAAWEKLHDYMTRNVQRPIAKEEEVEEIKADGPTWDDLRNEKDFDARYETVPARADDLNSESPGNDIAPLKLSSDELSQVFHAAMVAINKGHSYQGSVLMKIGKHYASVLGIDPSAIKWYGQAEQAMNS